MLSMPNLSYISPKAIVQASSIHGRGLFAIAPIAKGEIVCIKGGYILTRDVLSTMPEWYGRADIPIADDLYIGPFCQEEREGGMIFSHHSCEVAVGMPVTQHPPHRSRRAALPHRAPASGLTCKHPQVPAVRS